MTIIESTPTNVVTMSQATALTTSGNSSVSSSHGHQLMGTSTIGMICEFIIYLGVCVS
jgi:hypothetical protein